MITQTPHIALVGYYFGQSFSCWDVPHYQLQHKTANKIYQISHLVMKKTLVTLCSDLTVFTKKQSRHNRSTYFTIVSPGYQSRETDRAVHHGTNAISMTIQWSNKGLCKYPLQFCSIHSSYIFSGCSKWMKWRVIIPLYCKLNEMCIISSLDLQISKIDC